MIFTLPTGTTAHLEGRNAGTRNRETFAGSSFELGRADAAFSMSLGRILPRAATEHGHRTAVFDIGRELTFEQADDAAGRMATALIGEGVQPGERIGVSLFKSADGFVAMHAIVRIGAVAVPLDPGSPTSRLAAICSQMDISVVITHDLRRAALIDLAKSVSLRAVLGLSDSLEDTHTVTGSSIASLEPADAVEMSDGDPAYIITTSGSTGEPKGIVHSHRSALAYADNSAATFGLVPEDRVSDIAPHHFDISTFALWSAPFACASIVVMPDVHQRMPASLSQRTADERVTVWYSVPFLLNQLVLRGDLANRDLSSIRLVQLGGEVIQPDALETFMSFAPNAVIANVYGPAETNQCSRYLLSAPPVPASFPIGRPWSAATFRVAEPGAEGPGAGVLDEGELWVAAETMMKGYFGETTPGNGRIVEQDGLRWYRTGDLVRLDSAGEFHFEGRADLQIKIRGHRVELEAIEAELERLPNVEAAVASPFRGSTGADEVVAGILPLEGFEVDDFLDAAREVLPGYAAPARTVILNSKKITGSGKLDRRALREEARVAAEGTTQ